LLVDDDPEVRRTLAEIMRERGLVVETAPNGPAGLRAASNRKPDVILLDIVMPGLDGGAVAQRLKADDRTLAVPLVAITGVTE
jgi:two-component system response regulator MprA